MLTKTLHCRLLQLPSHCEPLYAISRYSSCGQLLQSIVAIERYCNYCKSLCCDLLHICCKTNPQVVASYCMLFQHGAEQAVASHCCHCQLLQASTLLAIASYCKLLQALALQAIAVIARLCRLLQAIACYCKFTLQAIVDVVPRTQSPKAFTRYCRFLQAGSNFCELSQASASIVSYCKPWQAIASDLNLWSAFASHAQLMRATANVASYSELSQANPS